MLVKQGHQGVFDISDALIRLTSGGQCESKYPKDIICCLNE